MESDQSAKKRKYSASGVLKRIFEDGDDDVELDPDETDSDSDFDDDSDPESL